MIAVQQSQICSDPAKYLSLAADGEEVSVPVKDNLTVAIISGAELNELRKARNNLEYLEMLMRSEQQLREGKVVVKTMEELEAMANE